MAAVPKGATSRTISSMPKRVAARWPTTGMPSEKYSRTVSRESR